MAKIRRVLTPRQKVLKLLRIFREGLDDYEQNEPEWFRVTLVQLVKDSLFNLKTYIESPHSPESTWKNPRTLLSYPVQWDWPANKSSRQLGRTLSLTFSSSDLKNRDQLVKKLSDGLFEHVRLKSLADITNETLRVSNRGQVVTALAGERLRILNSVTGKKQANLLALLCEPVRLNPPHRSLPAPADRIINQEFWNDPIDLHFTVTLSGGKVINGEIDASFHRLELDLDEHTSYYPIEIGLVFSDEISSQTWSMADRELFWKQLYSRCDDLIDHERQRLVRKLASTLAASFRDNPQFFGYVRTELNRDFNKRSEHFLQIPIVPGMAQLFECETQAYALQVKARTLSEGGWPNFLQTKPQNQAIPDQDDLKIGGLKASRDFRTFIFRKKTFSITAAQCEIFRILWNAYTSGQPDLSEKQIMREVNRSATDRMRNIFRSRPEFFKLFIRRTNPGIYALNLPM